MILDDESTRSSFVLVFRSIAFLVEFTRKHLNYRSIVRNDEISREQLIGLTQDRELNTNRKTEFSTLLEQQFENLRSTFHFSFNDGPLEMVHKFRLER